jgi:hypothetical protein
MYPSSLFPAEDDILEASNHISISDRRDGQAKVDADFFNKFDDDADESDMKPSTS